MGPGLHVTGEARKLLEAHVQEHLHGAVLAKVPHLKAAVTSHATSSLAVGCPGRCADSSIPGPAVTAKLSLSPEGGEPLG